MTFEDPIIADVVKVFQLHITDLAIALIVLTLAKESKPPAGSRKKWVPPIWIGAALVLGVGSAVLNRTNLVVASEQWSPAAKWYFAFLGLVSAPICEELFFRKMSLDLYPN